MKNETPTTPPPTPENVERARKYLTHRGELPWLASEFAASDAIARRRALEEAAEACMRTLADLEEEKRKAIADGTREWSWVDERVNGALACLGSVRALLRAPTSEKSECTCKYTYVERGSTCPIHGQPSGEGK